jgi:hypothetical protein
MVEYKIPGVLVHNPFALTHLPCRKCGRLAADIPLTVKGTVCVQFNSQHNTACIIGRTCGECDG